MEGLSLFLRVMGVVVYIVGWFATVREMFAVDRRDFGYASFLFPILTLIFAAMNMDELKHAFWFQAAGVVLYGAGLLALLL